MSIVIGKIKSKGQCLLQVLTLCFWVVACSLGGNHLSAQVQEDSLIENELKAIATTWDIATTMDEKYQVVGKYSAALQRAVAATALSDAKLVKSYKKLGNWYNNDLGEFQKAKENFLLALDKCPPRKDLDSTQAQIYRTIAKNLAMAFSRLGQMDEAKNYGLLANEMAANFPEEQASMLTNLSVIYRNFGEYPNAIRVARQSLAIRKALLQKARLPSDKQVLTRKLSNSLANLADALNEWGKPDSAIFYLGQTMPLRKLLEASTLMEIEKIYGLAYQQQGDFEKAFLAFDNAVALSQPDSNRHSRELGMIYEAQGQCYAAANRHEDALKRYQKALIAFTRGFEDTIPSHNPAQELWEAEPWLFQNFADKAASFAALNQIDPALRCYEAAFAYVNHLRENFNTSDAKAFISSVIYESHEKAIALALGFYQQTKEPQQLDRVFEFMERSKTNEILESLCKAEQFKAYKLPDSLLNQLRTIQARKSTQYHSQQPNEQLLDRLKDQERVIWDQIDARAPGFKNLTEKIDLATPSAVQANLHGDQVFLEYFIGASNIYIFAIDADHYDCFSVPKPRQFQATVDQVIDMLQQAPKGNAKKLFVAYQKPSYALFRLLVGPLIEQKFRTKAVKSLIVVPDGRLSLLPFECLITQPIAAANQPTFQTGAYLMRDCEVRYGHSATTLRQQRLRKRPSGELKNFLAMTASPPNSTLSPLQNIKAEAISAEEALGGRVIRNASKADFTDNAAAYRFLHFACHAKADFDNPLKSWIALQNDQGAVDTLYAYEIMGQKLAADLAVLSACETGLGKLQTGEGVMSLARSFFVAGCPRVMMSLWKLDDEVTATIMEKFYKGIKAGKPAAQSLREAHLAFLDDDAFENDPIRYHPYYWAAMVMVGDEGPYLQQGPSSWRPWIIWGIIFAFLIALTQRRRRKRKRKAA
jgi:CHAT domain-containing protein